MPTEELAKRYIRSPKTQVYINHNNKIGCGLYSVVVVDSDAFWLDSFDTEQEAMNYVRTAGLKLVAPETAKQSRGGR